MQYGRTVRQLGHVRLAVIANSSAARTAGVAVRFGRAALNS